uniref:Uncharacterized protein n=1 Tax=Zea mays TaxID=4577 RepID=B6SH77_MAIZE|nr:hypothetical protein [Zea mays]
MSITYFLHILNNPLLKQICILLETLLAEELRLA